MDTLMLLKSLDLKEKLENFEDFFCLSVLEYIQHFANISKSKVKDY